MAVSLNVANSIVDYLKGQGQAYDYQTRKGLYDKAGLGNTFGDFQGSASQNTALLKQLQTPSSPTTPYGTTDKGATITPTTPPVPTDIQAGVTPEAAIGTEVINQNRAPGTAPPGTQPDPTGASEGYATSSGPSSAETALQAALKRRQDAAASAADKYAPELATNTADYLGALTRGARDVPANLTDIQKTGEANVSAAKRGTIAARLAAESALAARGIRSSGIADSNLTNVGIEGAAKEATASRDSQVKLQAALKQAEDQYGSDFLKNLGIPAASEYASLPAPIRGALAATYERQQTSVRGNIQSETDKLVKDASAADQLSFENDLKIANAQLAQSKDANDREKTAIDLMLRVPQGTSFEYDGNTYTGAKVNDPQIQVITKEDSRGNTTVIGLDKSTGEELYKKTYTGIGKATKTAVAKSSGGSSSGGTGGTGGGGGYTFSATKINGDSYPTAFVTYFRNVLLPTLQRDGTKLTNQQIYENYQMYQGQKGGTSGGASSSSGPY